MDCDAEHDLGLLNQGDGHDPSPEHPEPRDLVDHLRPLLCPDHPKRISYGRYGDDWRCVEGLCDYQTKPNMHEALLMPTKVLITVFQRRDLTDAK